ncbi:hypothetical protein ONE63_004329 [Megalurothrips usitatus]|uniref:Golgin subfamily A conserved domain-containing protein n=1 Tax=Megalurothrips usitatus TaxID=439358 RepID=A0AAV7X828_9NEOP|nr:hypothetical protein ONE63_004329 [Megalurothrips usitatus]
MADMSKAERLAAARKKLQDFQRKKEGLPATGTIPVNLSPQFQTGPNPLPVEQFKQDTHVEPLDENLKSNIYASVNQHGAPGPGSHLTSEEVPYFHENHSTTNGFQPLLSTNFENIPYQSDTLASGYASNVGASEAPAVFCGNSYFNNFGNMGAETFPLSNNSHETSQMYSLPPIDGSSNSTAHLFASSDDRMDKWNFNTASALGPTDMLNTTKEQDLSSLPNDQILEGQSSFTLKEESPPIDPFLPETPSHEPTKELQIDSVVSTLDGDNMTAKKELEVPLNERSSTESIRQLSDQISQLMNPSVVEEEHQNYSFTSSLETRNQELAAQLAAEHRNNQQLQFNLKESQSLVSHLQAKVEELQSQQEVMLARHLGPLQEQLRAHAQTVGILVGEKTELEAAIAHHTATAKHHASEVEELQNRLRASRHRVSELEKELTSATSAANAADKQKNNHVQEVDQLRLQNGMLSKQLEDAEEEASELRQKLSARVSEVGVLTTQLQETQSQLSLSQLRVTQLSASDNPEASAEIESLHQLKISLERRCNELTEAVRQISADRDQADQQYQQYVAQLNGQLQSANSKLETVSLENEKLKSREEDLVQNMSELERQLQQQIQLHQQQQLQHNQVQQQSQQQPELGLDGHSDLQEKITELEVERERLQSSLDAETQELGRLRTELKEKDARIYDLETLCNDRPDQSRLLAAMESDKVAAAQATTQNSVLKQQLQELQDGFIKMSNDKLNLTESLEHEKHVNKEMGEKISQLAEELHELRVLVADKERRLQEYREHGHNHEHSHEHKHEHSPEQKPKHVQNHGHEHNHDHNNCNDSHGHEHNHNHAEGVKENVNEKHSAQVATTLQEQLHQAHEHIHNLNSQNNNLRRLIAQKSTESHESGSSSSATEGATTDDAAADQETNCEDGDAHINYSSMQYAMEKLQERFTRTMAEVAELSDEKQRLEHLVLQLQGETETIGEYVALYQMQRAALQQRAREKDHQLANLSSEREDLRRKLQELNQLVQRLLDDRRTETAKEALSGLDLSNEIGTSNESDIIEIPTETTGQEVNANQDVAKRLTKQIMSIIEDIGVSSDVEASFHPCPWCSGRLKNV